MDIGTASHFEIGDKVEQSYSNHGEGTVIAIFTNKSGERRYAVEIAGHSAIQVVSAGSLSAHGDGAK